MSKNYNNNLTFYQDVNSFFYNVDIDVSWDNKVNNYNLFIKNVYQTDNKGTKIDNSDMSKFSVSFNKYQDCSSVDFLTKKDNIKETIPIKQDLTVNIGYSQIGFWPSYSFIDKYNNFFTASNNLSPQKMYEIFGFCDLTFEIDDRGTQIVLNAFNSNNLVVFICDNLLSSQTNNIIDVYYSFNFNYLSTITTIPVPFLFYLKSPKIQFKVYYKNSLVNSGNYFQTRNNYSNIPIVYPMVLTLTRSKNTNNNQKYDFYDGFLPLYMNILNVTKNDNNTKAELIQKTDDYDLYKNFLLEYYLINKDGSISIPKNWNGDEIQISDSDINNLVIPSQFQWNGSDDSNPIYFPGFFSIMIYNKSTSFELWNILFDKNDNYNNSVLSITPSPISDGFNGNVLTSDPRDYFYSFFTIKNNESLKFKHFLAGYQQLYEPISIYGTDENLTTGSTNGLQQYNINITDRLQRYTGLFFDYQTSISRTNLSKTISINYKNSNYPASNLYPLVYSSKSYISDLISVKFINSENDNLNYSITFSNPQNKNIDPDAVWTLSFYLIDTTLLYPVYAASGIMGIYFINNFEFNVKDNDISLYQSIYPLLNTSYNQTPTYIQPNLDLSEQTKIYQTAMNLYKILYLNGTITFRIPTSDLSPINISNISCIIKVKNSDPTNKSQLFLGNKYYSGLKVTNEFNPLYFFKLKSVSNNIVTIKNWSNNQFLSVNFVDNNFIYTESESQDSNWIISSFSNTTIKPQRPGYNEYINLDFNDSLDIYAYLGENLFTWEIVPYYIYEVKFKLISEGCSFSTFYMNTEKTSQGYSPRMVSDANDANNIFIIVLRTPTVPKNSSVLVNIYSKNGPFKDQELTPACNPNCPSWTLNTEDSNYLPIFSLVNLETNDINLGIDKYIKVRIVITGNYQLPNGTNVGGRSIGTECGKNNTPCLVQDTRCSDWIMEILD